MTARGWFYGSALLLATVLVWMWTSRPDGQVPLHFGAGGEPDRWGTPLRAVTESAVVGGGLFLLMWALATWIPRIPWSMVNVPHKEAWESRQDWVRDRVRDDVLLTGAWTLLLLAGLDAAVWSTLDDPEPGMGWGGPWLAFMLVVFVAGMFWRMRIYLTPPDELPPGTVDG